MSISPLLPGVELRGLKDCIASNIITYWNEKVISLNWQFWTALTSKVNLPSHFSTYLKHDNLSSPIALLLEEKDMCAQWVFCWKFNSQQLLLEVVFGVICNFGSIEHCSESTFPFHYIIIFETWLSFEGCTFFSPWEDRHVHPLSFL